MVLFLMIIPFLGVIIAALILFNTGRTNREKLSLFIITPDDADRESSNLIDIIRFLFWGLLIVCLWIVVTIIRNRQ